MTVTESYMKVVLYVKFNQSLSRRKNTINETIKINDSDWKLHESSVICQV